MSWYVVQVCISILVHHVDLYRARARVFLSLSCAVFIIQRKVSAVFFHYMRVFSLAAAFAHEKLEKAAFQQGRHDVYASAAS
jgi:hypothetical protein